MGKTTNPHTEKIATIPTVQSETLFANGTVHLSLKIQFDIWHGCSYSCWLVNSLWRSRHPSPFNLPVLHNISGEASLHISLGDAHPPLTSLTLTYKQRKSVYWNWSIGRYTTEIQTHYIFWLITKGSKAVWCWSLKAFHIYCHWNSLEHARVENELTNLSNIL